MTEMSKEESRRKLERDVEELNNLVEAINRYTLKVRNTDAEWKEYRRLRAIYDEKKEQYKKDLKAWNEASDKERLKATHLKIGDRVEYALVSPFGFAEELTGTVVNYRGRVKVKLDRNLDGTRYTDLHKGWKKIYA
jgi:polyribonucleotide nucleotidyltransferase